MSTDLIAQIGRDLFGDQWRAPFARLLGVSDRSLRAWTALEAPVPDGVWRDLLRELERRRATADYYLGEVRKELGEDEVFAFEIFDTAKGENIRVDGMSTRERIQRIRGASIVPGTGEFVDRSELDAEGRLVRLDLTGDEARFLGALAVRGGEMTISGNFNHHLADRLLHAGMVVSVSLNLHDIRYRLTDRGRVNASRASAISGRA